MVLRRSLSLALVGASAGVLLALGLAQLLSWLLFGVAPWDPVSYLSALVVLYVVTVAASMIPVRRAATIDPMAALSCAMAAPEMEAVTETTT